MDTDQFALPRCCCLPNVKVTKIEICTIATLKFYAELILLPCFPGPGCSKLTTSLVNETLKF